MSEKRNAAEKTERKDEREMNGKERELLYGTADRFGIYQLKDDPALSGLHKGTWTLKQAGILKEDAEAAAIKPENYDLVYVGDLSKLKAQTFGLDTTEDTLHALFEKFNIYQPADYTGRPLSVSDIVVLHESGENTAHYVDSTDYTEMPHFIRGLEGRKENEQETDRTGPEGGQMRPGSLRKALEACKTLSSNENGRKNHQSKDQKKEPSL